MKSSHKQLARKGLGLLRRSIETIKHPANREKHLAWLRTEASILGIGGEGVERGACRENGIESKPLGENRQSVGEGGVVDSKNMQCVDGRLPVDGSPFGSGRLPGADGQEAPKAKESGSVGQSVGWPEECEVTVWRSCANPRLMAVVLDDGRMVSMARGGRVWARNQRVKVKLISGGGSPIYGVVGVGG